MTRYFPWSVARWFLAAATLVSVWACQVQALLPPDPKTYRTLNQVALLNPSQQIDILFLIDTSDSMKAEQDNLARNFPIFMSELEKVSQGRLDVHIAVISSDLGAGPEKGVPGCTAGGENGAFISKPRPSAGCLAMPKGSFIASGPGGNNFDGPIADVFSCIARLGGGGCGFEHQLAAVRRALGGDPQVPMPAQNAGFLRDDARLAVILITDEDDCSAPPDTDLFTTTDTSRQSKYGQLWSYRCGEFGHLCGGAPPPRRAGVTLTDCHSNETPTSKLTHVADFVSFLKSRKKQPDMVSVAAITGPDMPYATVEVTTMGGSFIDVAPSCGGGKLEEGAAPAVRLHEFVQAFGKKGIVRSICTPDFGTIMADIVGVIIPDKAACVGARLVDREPKRAGLQPDCVVVEETPVNEGTSLTNKTIPHCDNNGGAAPCWTLEKNPDRCPVSTAPESWEIKVQRGGAAPPVGARLNFSCDVCVRDDDLSCGVR